MLRIAKIAIIGGSNNGSADAIDYIREHYDNSNTVILTVPNALTPSEKDNALENAIAQYNRQLIYENLVISHWMTNLHLTPHSDADIVVICDRALPDIPAILPQELYEEFFEQLELEPDDLTCPYDAIIYLEGDDDKDIDFCDAWYPYNITSKKVTGTMTTRNADTLLQFKQLIDQLF